MSQDMTPDGQQVASTNTGENEKHRYKAQVNIDLTVQLYQVAISSSRLKVKATNTVERDIQPRKLT